MSTADTQRSTAVDGPTLAAAGVTLAFAVVSGVIVSSMPQDGGLGGVFDSLKNLVYVLTVPLFDISRRMFANRRQAAAAAAPPAGAPNALRLAFVSALVLFVLIELASLLTGYGMGSVCATMVQSGAQTDFGQCFTLGINVFSAALIGPIMISLGITAGWIWQGQLKGGLLIALIMFMIAVAALFSLDFFILLQQIEGPTAVVKDQFNAVGPVRQIGLQVAILTVSVLLGYGARRLWSAIAGVFG